MWHEKGIRPIGTTNASITAKGFILLTSPHSIVWHGSSNELHQQYMNSITYATQKKFTHSLTVWQGSEV